MQNTLNGEHHSINEKAKTSKEIRRKRNMQGVPIS